MKIPLSFLAPIKTLFTSISETSHINSYPFPRNAGILLLSSILSLTTVTSQSSRAQVWTNKTKYHPNEAIVVHFNGMSGANSDWIAVTQSHKGDNTYDIYKYIQGEREGSLSFSNLKSGSYEARAYFKNTYVVQARYAFTISTNDSPTSGNDNAAYKPIGNDVKPTDLGLNSQSRIGSVECFTCGATSNYHNLRGSDTYTPDSYICSAAIHAGKIGPAGGNVCIRITAPPTTWGKGKRNGVTSFGTGAKHSTGFVFTNGDARDQSDILPPDNPFIQLPPPTTIDNSNNNSNSNRNYRTIGNDVKPSDFGLNDRSRIGSVECFTCGATSNYHNLRGSDTYTPDSYICSAAIHAGKIGPAGGNVCIRITAPPATWGKGKRNGVTSFGTGAKHSTGFVFTNGDARDQSDILPPDNPFIQLPPPTTIDNSNNNSNSNRDYRTIGNDVKPSDFGLNDKSRIGSVECFTCGATSNYHNLRGSDTYTPDSYICSAAIHAGKIGPAGGNVCIQITAPPATWGKGKRNGVTSFGTGAKHPTGFIFTGNAHHGSANLIPHSDPFVQLPPPSSTNNASTAWRVDYGPYEVDGLTVSATPSGDGKTSYYIAPRNYHGNWSGYTGISFEKKSWGGSYYGPTSHGAYGDVVLKSGKMTATLTISKDHTGNFRYYTIPFNSRVWRLEGGAIRIGDVLRNVTDFRIRAEYGEGTDYSSIRNVGLLK